MKHSVQKPKLLAGRPPAYWNQIAIEGRIAIRKPDPAPTMARLGEGEIAKIAESVRITAKNDVYKFLPQNMKSQVKNSLNELLNLHPDDVVCFARTIFRNSVLTGISLIEPELEFIVNAVNQSSPNAKKELLEELLRFPGFVLEIYPELWEAVETLEPELQVEIIRKLASEKKMDRNTPYLLKTAKKVLETQEYTELLVLAVEKGYCMTVLNNITDMPLSTKKMILNRIADNPQSISSVEIPGLLTIARMIFDEKEYVFSLEKMLKNTSYVTKVAKEIKTVPLEYQERLWTAVAEKTKEGIGSIPDKSKYLDRLVELSMPKKLFAEILVQLLSEYEESRLVAVCKHLKCVVHECPEVLEPFYQRTKEYLLGKTLEAWEYDLVEQTKFLKPEQRTELLCLFFERGFGGFRFGFFEKLFKHARKLPKAHTQKFLDVAVACIAKALESKEYVHAFHAMEIFKLFPDERYAELVICALKCSFANVIVPTVELIKRTENNTQKELWKMADQFMKNIFATREDFTSFQPDKMKTVDKIVGLVGMFPKKYKYNLTLAAITGENAYTATNAIRLAGKLKSNDKTPELWSHAYGNLSWAVSRGYAQTIPEINELINKFPDQPITGWQRFWNTSYRKKLERKIKPLIRNLS